LTGPMRRFWSAGLWALLIGVTVSCAHRDGPRSAATARPVLTPDTRLTGRIVSVNEVGNFVVLQFPGGRLPVPGQSLAVYREGLKVGELKVSGPQREDHIVADVTAGEVRTGDEVRSN